MREQGEDGFPVGTFLPRPGVAALQMRARALDQLVVLDPARARGHARHAAEAAVEVLDHLLGDRRALLVADPHQHDAPARRVGLVLEHRVARARRQAEAAVDAVLDQVQLRWMRGVPGVAHIPPTKLPGRKSRAGSKRAFSRSITTCAPPASGHCSPTRSAPSRTVQARGASAWRAAVACSAPATAIHESPSAPRDTTDPSRAARITAGRSVGRPETFSTIVPRWRARWASHSDASSSITSTPSSSSSVARARSTAVLPE